MSISELAIKYGIRENAVRKIIKNKMWSNRSEAQQ
jgi:Mor family transcriptional regulator